MAVLESSSPAKLLTSLCPPKKNYKTRVNHHKQKRNSGAGSNSTEGSTVACMKPSRGQSPAPPYGPLSLTRGDS